MRKLAYVLALAVGLVDHLVAPALAAQAYQKIPASSISGTVTPSQGGTGVANNNAATLTRSGNHALTLTTTGTTGLTLPTSGTLYAVGGALGTPTSGTLTNATGLPIAGITGLGTNVGTGLATTLNGTGALAGTTSPVFVTPSFATSINVGGAAGSPIVILDGAASGNPYVSWRQNAVEKSYAQWSDADTRLNIGGPVAVVGTLTGTGAVLFPGLATGSAATVGTLCQTVTTGNITVNTTLACLASTERYKENIRPMDMGLREVMALRPVIYDLKPEFNPTGLGEMPGLVAEEVEKVDARLVGLDPDGTVQGVRYMQMVALAIKAIQEQQEQITELRAKLREQQAMLDALPQYRVMPVGGIVSTTPARLQ